MLHLITIKPTVGKALKALVTVSEKNGDKLHSVLKDYITDLYGEYAAIEYSEQWAIAAVVINAKIDLFVNVDELIENKLL